MQKINNALQYVYYLIGLSWLVWGLNFYFVKLAAYHQNYKTAIYGLLIMLGILYVGFLHKKASTGQVIVFPIISSINLVLLLSIIYIYFLSQGNALTIYLLGGVLALVSFMTLSAGTLEVKKLWPKSVFLTVILVILLITWTYIFTSF